MPNVPLKTQNVITALAKNPDIPRELVDAMLELYSDVQTMKSALYGLGRDGKGDLGFDNPSFRNKIGDQRAMTLTKDGILNLGSQYGVRPDVMMNVLGSVYAVPQWGKWRQTTNSPAGVDGAFVWDTELFNNTYDLYQRVAGNTQIKFTEPGDYFVSATGSAYNISAAPVGAAITCSLWSVINGVFIVQKTHRIDFPAAPNIYIFTFGITAIIQTVTKNDIIQLYLSTYPSPAASRLGSTEPYSTLEVCKLN